MTRLDIEWKDAKGKLHYKCLSKKAGLSYISFLIEDGAQHIHVTRVS